VVDTIRFDGPYYVACEGDGDAAFVEHLLKHCGLAGFAVKPSQGRTRFEGHLCGVATSSDRRRLRCLVVLADNDDAPTTRFEGVQRALNAAGFPVPDRPQVIVPGSPSVGVFMVPSAGRIGALETILLEAVDDADPGLRRCVDEFVDCQANVKTWSLVKQAKMRLHASIAATCVEDPGAALSRVWNKTGNPIPLHSGRFNELAGFFGEVVKT
jgi:hypothetical protein